MSSELTQALSRIDTIARTQKVVSLGAFLPLLLRFQGKPLSLEKFFPHEPFYRLGKRPRKMISLAGRQVGKCGAPDTQITRENGIISKLSELRVGDRLLGVDPDTLKVVKVKVEAISREKRDCIRRIHLRSGRVLTFTTNHRLLCDSGFTEVGDLKPGDRLARAYRYGVFQDKSQPDARVRLTAYLIGDGGLTSGHIGFTNMNDATLNDFYRCMHDIGVNYKAVKLKKGKATQVQCSVAPSILRTWLDDDSLRGKYSYEKTLPDWVFQLSEEQTITFINCLWATDGSVLTTPHGWEVSYTSTCEMLAHQVRNLLAKLGIRSAVRERKTICNGKRCRPAWVCRVNGRDGWSRFKELISVNGRPFGDIPTTEERSNLLSYPPAVSKRIYELGGLAGSKHGDSLYSLGLARSTAYNLSKPKLLRYIAFFKTKLADTSLDKYIDGDCDWDRVEEIERAPDQDMIDIQVTGPHTFLIDGGLVSHNSVMQSGTGLVDSALIPYFNTIYAFPLQSQGELFSNAYVTPMAKDSPLTGPMLSGKDAVLQKDFLNGSKLYFRYIGDSADRARGISAGSTKLDEIQDHDLREADVLAAAMSASPYKFLTYTGTPKTFDNGIQKLWEESSQAEWCIPCTRCNNLNLCCTQQGLLDMIGPTTLVCAKCKEPVDSSSGYYVHAFPSRQLQFAGYHMPQAIFPIHYADRLAWGVLREILEKKPKYYWMNEILGESYDSGTKLITLDELKAAATCTYTTPSSFTSGPYMSTSLGIDWGGKGKEKAKDREEFISNTALALMGMRADGIIEVSWLYRTPYSMNYTAEAELVQQAAKDASVNWVASDNGGAGDLREHVLIAAGVDPSTIVPFTYSGNMSRSKPIVFYEPPTDAASVRGARASYSLDKTRSLTLLIEGIKRRRILLPEFEKVPDELSDFMSLVEETRERPTGAYARFILRMSGRTDDVAHAINFGVMALYHSTGMWPDFATDLISDSPA